MASAAAPVPADIDIARLAKMLPVAEIAAKLGIPDDDLEVYGKHKAKVSLDLFRRLHDAPTGRLILVTAVTPRHKIEFAPGQRVQGRLDRGATRQGNGCWGQAFVLVGIVGIIAIFKVAPAQVSIKIWPQAVNYSRVCLQSHILS